MSRVVRWPVFAYALLAAVLFLAGPASRAAAASGAPQLIFSYGVGGVDRTHPAKGFFELRRSAPANRAPRAGTVCDGGDFNYDSLVVAPTPHAKTCTDAQRARPGPRTASRSSTSRTRLTRAAREGAATTSRVTANRTAGNAFRDTVAGRLENELGVNVLGKEVAVRTPLGRRVIDILGERNGSLVAFETKFGGSRYLPSQRAKDFYLSRVGVDVLGNGTRTRIPTVVIRGPLR